MKAQEKTVMNLVSFSQIPLLSTSTEPLDQKRQEYNSLEASIANANKLDKLDQIKSKIKQLEQTSSSTTEIHTKLEEVHSKLVQIQILKQYFLDLLAIQTFDESSLQEYNTIKAMNVQGTNLNNLYRSKLNSSFEIIKKRLFSLDVCKSTISQLRDLDQSLIFNFIARPFTTRLQYHFNGSKPTNNPSKPEWMFQYIREILQNETKFLDTEIQPILDDQGIELDAHTEFKREIAQFVKEKFKNQLSTLSPEILSYTIVKTNQFDFEFKTDITQVFSVNEWANFELSKAIAEMEKLLKLDYNELAYEEVLDKIPLIAFEFMLLVNRVLYPNTTRELALTIYSKVQVFSSKTSRCPC